MAAAGEVENVLWAAFIADAEEGAAPLDIHTAANLGDETTILEAIQSDPGQAAARNGLGWSPLMFAVWQGHERLVLLLLRAAHRSGLDAADPALGRTPRSGRTLLMVAVRFGHLAAARMLCHHRTLETRDFRGQTALFHAVRGGREDAVRFLIAHGANVNACDNQGRSVLRLAEACRSASTMRLLRDAGAKLEVAVLPRSLSTPQPGHASAAAAVADATQGGFSLTSVLESISLQKYVVLFQLHRIDFNGFLAMNEDDLRRIGVSLLGPRRKMAMEIDRLRSLYGKSDLP